MNKDTAFEDALADARNVAAVSETEIEEINELLSCYSNESPVLSDPSRKAGKTFPGLPSSSLSCVEDERSVTLSDVIQHEEEHLKSQDKPKLDFSAIWDDIDEITDMEADSQSQKARESQNATTPKDAPDVKGGVHADAADEQKSPQNEATADVQTATDEVTTAPENRMPPPPAPPASDKETKKDDVKAKEGGVTFAPIPRIVDNSALSIKPPPIRAIGDEQKEKISIKPAAIAKQEADARKAEAEKKAAEERAQAEKKAAEERAQAEKKAAEARAQAEKKAAEARALAEKRAAGESSLGNRLKAADYAEKNAAMAREAAEERARREKANLEAVAQAQREIRETVARVEAMKKKELESNANLPRQDSLTDSANAGKAPSTDSLPRVGSAEVPKVDPQAAVAKDKKSGAHPSISLNDFDDDESNPAAADLGTRLNNLTGRRVGKRPEWVDLETVTLPDRDRECHRLYWMIEDCLKRKQKKLMSITAEHGMGKTMFLAQLYSLLSRSRNDIVTLTPAYSTTGRPFAAIRNILEQRFYITAVSPDDVQVQLSWPVFSMIPNRDKAERLLKRLENIWEKSKSAREFEYEDSACDWSKDSSKEDKMGQSSNPVAFDKNSRTLETEIAPYMSAIRMLFKADLLRNSMVLLLDDISRYDIESLALLASVFETLPDCPLTIVMTMRSEEEMPKVFSHCPCEKYEMSSLSDSDLVCYSRRILEKMSQSREKLIIPAELCQVVAQHSCGSPMRARNYMTKLFHPDMMLQWNVNLETLKKEPVDERIRQKLKERLRLLPPRESAILGIVSVLNAPFTVHTLDAIMPGATPGAQHNGKYIRRLYERGFLSMSKEPLLNNAVTYIFKHEFERLGISSLIARDVCMKVYASAAQWYALNNLSGNFNETIGDLWRMQAELMLQRDSVNEVISPERMLKAQSHYMEASHYYERVAYSYMARAQYVQARRMFKKLLKALPVENISRRIQAALDASRVSMRLGNIDEAIRLAKSAGRHAKNLSAFSMVAAASIQIAEILLVMENTRHIRKYIAQAREMLNLGMIPSLMLKTYIVEIRDDLLHTKLDRAQKVLERAEKFVEKYDLRTVETLELRRCRADIVAVVGKPFDAVRLYEGIISDAERVRANAIYADTWRVLGTLQFKLEENDQAFRSWNIALGLAQETNDVCLHANLLCDIAEGAIMIRALKTARSVCEQSLSLARQIRHSALIGRCLLNQATMLVIQKDYERADRLLRRVRHIGQKMRMPGLIFSTLTVTGQCLSAPQYSHYDIPKADDIFKRVIAFYERRGLKLDLVCRLPLFAKHYLATQQNIQALNAYRQALDVYHSYAMTKSCRFVETQMRQIFGADVLDPKGNLS